jgi:hypothetical protein
MLNMDMEEYRARLQTVLDASHMKFNTLVTDGGTGTLVLGVVSLYSEPAMLVVSGEDWMMWAKDTPDADNSMQDVKVRTDSPAGMLAISLISREIMSMYNAMLMATWDVVLEHYPDIDLHYNTAFNYLDWLAENDDSKAVSARARQTLDLTRAAIQANNDRIDRANESTA